MKKILNLIKTLFSFSTTRKLLNASAQLQTAIQEAEQARIEDGRRRFVFFDPNQRKLITLTYHAYKGRGDSYQYLRRRGRFTKAMSYQEFKDASYYFTGSKNGATACSQEEQREKALRWQKMYHRMKR